MSVFSKAKKYVSDKKSALMGKVFPKRKKLLEELKKVNFNRADSLSDYEKIMEQFHKVIVTSLNNIKSMEFTSSSSVITLTNVSGYVAGFFKTCGSDGYANASKSLNEIITEIKKIPKLKFKISNIGELLDDKNIKKEFERIAGEMQKLKNIKESEIKELKKLEELEELENNIHKAHVNRTDAKDEVREYTKIYEQFRKRCKLYYGQDISKDKIEDFPEISQLPKPVDFLSDKPKR